MSRYEFLDILKDYLKGYFSDFEINDIIRDYEEFFINGELSGKSDEETIKSLGSPKLIAKDLIGELKLEDKENFNKSNSVNKSNIYFLEKLRNSLMDIKDKTKKVFKKISKKVSDMFSSNKILNAKAPSSFIKLMLIVLTLLLLFPLFFIAIGAAFACFFLAAGTVGNVLGYVFSLIFITMNGSVGIFGLFLNLIFTGVVLILWVVFINAVKLIKNLILHYISFLKTKNMYIKLKKKKEEVIAYDEEEK